MAERKNAVPNNVAGDFFVDTTCINCDTCRQLAPGTFEDGGEYSYVYAQPQTDEHEREAARALISCPTASIGTSGSGGPSLIREVVADFPLLLSRQTNGGAVPGSAVYYCGFNSEKSYGGNSFFVTAPGGNWLIDSPRFVTHLKTRFQELGGIKYIFLTHRDDVADADRYARQFGSQRIIHQDDLSANPGAEIVIAGQDSLELEPGLVIIPVPGHTRGHMVLLLGDKYLFTGDHLAYDRQRGHLSAFRNHCWYSWEQQTKSMEKLKNYRFEWVLAGHGDRIRMDADKCHEQLSALVERMKLPRSQWYED